MIEVSPTKVRTPSPGMAGVNDLFVVLPPSSRAATGVPPVSLLPGVEELPPGAADDDEGWKGIAV